MKILLLGKNGQVGWELQRSLATLGELIALDRHSVDYCGDLSNVPELVNTIHKLKPDVIINAAAYTAVDKAESDSELAYRINALAPEAIAKSAALLGALLIHYSTDYVFNGEGDNYRQEADATSPLNIYGQSKLAGERAIINSGCRYYIFRTSWVYAARGNNFAKTMLKFSREKKSLNLINDQFGAPTGADLIADVTALVLHKNQFNTATEGIYHLVANGETTWFEYAHFVWNFARSRGESLLLLPQHVSPISTATFNAAAQRPLNSRLSTQKLQKNIGLVLPHWKLGVARMLTEITERN